MDFARFFGGHRCPFGLPSCVICVILWLTLTTSVANSSAKTWPWLAFIPSLKCTGAIVHSRWLLTATRCFQDEQKIPSELFIEVQDLSTEGKLTGVRKIFVIDYTRDERLESTHGLAMLYLARTIPSLTREVVDFTDPANSTLLEGKAGIVLSWDSKAGSKSSNPTSPEVPHDINIIALLVDINTCADRTHHLCVSLDKQLSSTTLYCTRVSHGSSLVVFNADGGVSLVGILHRRSDCRASTQFLGRFTRVSRANDWIQRQFRMQDFPQCQPSVYRNLDDPLRDLRKERTGSNVLCDANLTRVWYRFTLQGEPAELPGSCPEVNKCGSSSTIWLPQANVIKIGKQVEMKACVTWTVEQTRFCCFWTFSIFVRHCGDYKVYRLQKPTESCSTLYCSNVTKGHCGLGKIGYKPNCRDSHPKLPKTLHFYPFFAFQDEPPNPHLYLRCLLDRRTSRSENIRYSFTISKIERKQDGTFAKRLIRSLETSRNYCDTLLMPKRHEVGFGDTVVCETRSFFRSSKDIKSPPLSSKTYHLGIEVHPSTAVVLAQSQSVNITFTLTLPVICPKQNSNCSLVIPLVVFLTDVSTGAEVQPLSSYFTLSKCSLVFKPKLCSRQKIVCGKETVRLTAGKNFRNMDVRLRIKLGPILSSDAVWKDNDFPVVDATLKPTSRFTCYAMSTSNIKTFGGSFFKHLGEGTFLFHRGISSSLEVQLRKWRCDSMSTCACAVAVREGDDVIIADMCGGQYRKTSLRIFVRSKLPLHQQTRIVESNDGKTFTIHFPSGSHISIDEFGWGINVYLTTLDFGDSHGLCHGLNSHATNSEKLSRKSSHISPIRKIKNRDSLFEGSILPLKSPPSTNKEFCGCSGLHNRNHSRSFCQPSSVGVEDGSNDITQKIVDNQNIIRRASSSIVSRLRHGYVETLQADGPASSSSSKRREVCEAMLNGTDAALVCKAVIREELWKNMWQLCLQDTQEGLHYTLLDSNGKVITRLCKDELEQRVDRESLIRRWKEKLCENRCSRNGKCQNGSCKCNVGYGSGDCSVPLHKAPKLFALEDPNCNARYELCEEIFVSGTPYLNLESLSCSFTPVQRSNDEWKEKRQGIVTAKALFYSLRGVICKMPREKRSDFVKSQDGFHIRVSNNGQQWSNPVLWVRYNSLCKNCSTIGHCMTKPGTCDIDFQCFINGDIHPKNRCLMCTASNPHKWSPREDNLPPVFTSPTEENITVFVNDVLSFLVKAVDPENRPLTITHDVPLAQLTANGEFLWSPKEEARKTIQILATDECGRTAAKYIDVIVWRCLCRNGGKCLQTTNNSYKCICPKTFHGPHCGLKISPCSSNPCDFGACVDNDTDYHCICNVGYHGDKCQLAVPKCDPNPCERGSCEDLVSGFRCECPPFYEGRLCETKVDPCASDPCVRGTCTKSNMANFECVCPEGFVGVHCAHKVTPCSPNPCHGGQCFELGTSMRCICPPRHHGTFCNVTGVFCVDKPCVNGVCESTMSGQRCVCQRGFTGEQCDILCDIDCVRGECVRGPRGTSCKCHEGFSGRYCNQKSTLCDPDPCAHGSCLDLRTSFVCHCDAGYSGTLCNTSACSHFGCGNGTCVLANGIPMCQCNQSFLGDHCERRHRHCDSSPCSNGVCVNGENSFECRCNPGYSGLLCDIKADPCSSSPCENGLCTVVVAGTFTCTCHAGYSGRLCETKEDPCLSNPCVYGTCELMSNGGFRCKCDRGFVGVLCENRFNVCSSNPCVNGRCFTFYEGTFRCSCRRGFTGTRCEVDRRACAAVPCYPGVSCTNVGAQFRCGNCPAGLVGDGVQCRRDKEDSIPGFPCPRQFCFRGVKCSIVKSQIHCGKCPPNYYGNGFDCKMLCRFSCLNGGTCVEPGVCRCPSGFLGATCSRVLCLRSCLNGGRCVAPNKCHCLYGFYGDRCEKATCNVKCLNGGRCVPPNRCQCPRGYAGQSCEQAVCTLPCLNGGQCVAPGTCRCPPGYFGTRCQEGTCYPQCRNGGICVRNNICACPNGYRGNRCQTAICRRPCQNSGRCFRKDRCSCPYGYWGETCQYVNCLQPCYNGGVCIKPSVCLCPKNYAGVSCQTFVG